MDPSENITVSDNSSSTRQKNQGENLPEKLFHLISSIALVKDKPSFLHKVLPSLKQLVHFNGLLIMVADNGHFATAPYLLHFDDQQYTSYVARDSRLLDGRLETEIIEQVLDSLKPVYWTMPELMNRPHKPDFITRYGENMRKVVAVPIGSRSTQKGVMFLFSANGQDFSPVDLNLLNSITFLISTAVFNIKSSADSINQDRESEIIMSLIKSLVPVRDRGQLESVLENVFSNVDFFDEGCISFLNPGEHQMAPVLLKQAKNSVFTKEWLSGNIIGFDSQDPFFTAIKHIKDATEFELSELLKMRNVPLYLRYWWDSGIKLAVAVPLTDGAILRGVLFLLSKGPVSLRPNLRLINTIALQVSTVTNNIWANEKIANQLTEISRFKQQLEIEKRYLQEEIAFTHNYSDIIGTSAAMKEVFSLVSKVSKTNSSVLIMGETGTGKELIARAIHNSSVRRDKVMVKVNCATLPANLIESELFGHERGSFTGAIDRRIGKFELANHGTIFLDEIGELPLALQVKLLRALQEKEIERIGGKVTIKTDVRIIAATNRDLLKEVQQGNFRSDLYFRLNVFPVLLPRLRDRKEDIPLLANHFAQKYRKKTLSNVHFTSRAMKQLIAYNWPGNVRELEHLIERSVLLARGKSISEVYLPNATSEDTKIPLQNSDVKTIDEIEREHILSVLKMVNGKVSGVGGAAEILKIPATTLSSKIARLKIKKGVAE